MAKSPKKGVELLPCGKIFRANEAKRCGVPKTTLLRLVSAGEVERIGRGLYILKSNKIKPQELDYVVACAKFGPKSVIGGVTALFHYNLIEQVPRSIWVLVPYEKKTTDRFYRCIRTKASPTIGVVERTGYRITGIERSIIEAFRYSSKIGLRTAVQAMKGALSQKLTSENKIYEMARAMKLENFIIKYWETIIA